jgi:hypothetical protein
LKWQRLITRINRDLGADKRLGYYSLSYLSRQSFNPENPDPAWLHPVRHVFYSSQPKDVLLPWSSGDHI